MLRFDKSSKKKIHNRTFTKTIMEYYLTLSIVYMDHNVLTTFRD